MSFHPRQPITPNTCELAAAAAILAPIIAEAYARAGRSTSAGLARALEIVETLKEGSQPCLSRKPRRPRR